MYPCSSLTVSPHPVITPPCASPPQTLQEERRQRAAALGLLPEQVPTAEGLTVRVVNNVVKKNEVKLRFHEAFKNDGYAEAFLYKQKVGAHGSQLL